MAGFSERQRPGVTIRYTSCGYHCLRQCILKVWVKDGAIVACEPDDTVNPGVAREDGFISEEAIDRGMTQVRPCAKGYSQTRMIYDPNRLKYPMKRVGKKGEGQFKRISWDEALDTIAQEMVRVRDTYGPFSILHEPYTIFCKSSLPLAPWFGAGIAGWDAHSTNGFEQPAAWVLGIFRYLPLGTSSYEAAQDETNVLKSKLIVLWGLNPVSALSNGWTYNLLRAKEKGIPVICVESRYTPSAEVLADQWIPIRPTTDVAMMIAMANVWFHEGLCDQVFIDRWVEPEGLARWKAYVMGASDGVDKTPQWAEGICGVPAETIEAFARLYARSKPVNLAVSLSMGRQFYGENATRASMYLQALTGNTLLPGGTAGAESGISVGRPTIQHPEVDWQRKPGTYNPPVLLAAYKWAKAIDTRDKLDRGEITLEEYNNGIGNAASNPAPNIKMVFLETNNHVNSLPDVNANIRAVRKVDTLVVSSLYTDMPSARYADVLLPQVATAFEGLECLSPVFSTDRFKRGSTPANYFIYRQKCVETPGETRSKDWVWTQLAKRLGMAEQYNPRLAGVSDEDWDEAIEQLHKEAYERWAGDKAIAVLEPPTWEDFQKKPVFRYEIKDPQYPFRNELKQGRNPFRGTPSGKIEFFSSGLAKGPDHLAANEFFPGSGICYGRGNLSPMAQMTMGGKDTFYSGDVEKYPLLMSSPHSLFRVHSFLDNSPFLRDECYRHALWMSVPDAKSRGIRDNDLVRVYNDLGEMVIPAYVTSKAVPGTVYIFHGAWYRPGEERSQLMPDGLDQGGSPNLLVHNEDLPHTIVGMIPCKGLVEVKKLEGV